MQANLGSTDRVIRVILSLILLGMFFVLEGQWRWLALLGLVPLLTAFAGWCPLYVPFGLSTRRRHRKAGF